MEKKAIRGLHLCPVSINSGDINLAESAEVALNPRSNIKWTRDDCRKLVTRDRAIQINKDFDFIVLGPGGIFLLDEVNGEGIGKLNNLPYSAIKKQSGYQWIISDDVLDLIEIPIIVFSVGWNQFRMVNRKYYPNKKSLIKLIEKSAYFSVRHNGDITDILANSDPSLKDKIDMCFCPTITSDYSPLIWNSPRKKIIAFQIANDRWQNRYGTKSQAFAKFSHIAKAMNHFRQLGYEIHIVDQCLDTMFIDWLKSSKNMKSQYKIVTLKRQSRTFQNNYYAKLETIFATRGHAQMIPLGLGTKVVSIISHNKLKYFLRDTGLESTGVEFKDVSLQKLLSAYKNAKNSDFKPAINIIKSNIDSNLEKIANILNA